MPNKSISQLPVATTIQTGDVLVLSREISPGVFQDFQVSESLIAKAPFSATVTIPSAQVLTLFDSRVMVVQTPGDGSRIMPIAAEVSLSGVGTPYATNIVVTILGENASPASQYWAAFPIDSATDVEYQVQSAAVNGQRLYVDQSMYVQSQTGNPTAGDGDLIVTVYYQLLY